MTDKTSTQNLTRTQLQDDPKKMDEYLRTLALEVDARMAAHWYDLGRATRPAFAVVRVNTPYVFNNDSFTVAANDRLVAWDTVEIDTTGLMVDLSADNRSIRFAEPGYYLFGGSVHCDGFGATATSDVAAEIRAGGVNVPVSDFRHDSGVGFVGSHASGLTLVADPAAVAGVTMGVSWIGSSTRNTTTITWAELYAVKVRDV